MWQSLGTFGLIKDGQWNYTPEINSAFEAYRLRHNLISDSSRFELGCIVTISTKSGQETNIFDPKTFSYRNEPQIFNLPTLPKELIQNPKIGLKRIDNTDLIWNIEVEAFIPVVSSNKYGSSIVLPSNVESSTEYAPLLAANPNRLGATIRNQSESRLFIDFNSEVDDDIFAVELLPDAYYELPFGYTGVVCGRWLLANGIAVIREFV